MLLIVTNRAELSSDFLILRLRERAIAFKRFNTEDFPSNATIQIESSDSDFEWSIELDGERYGPSQVEGIYFRQPMLAGLGHIDESDRPFAEAEVAEALRSLWRVIPDELWLNRPSRIWFASNKVLQLKVARSLGFKTPPTLISNDIETIERFALQWSRRKLVAKAVKHGFVHTQGQTMLAGTQAFSVDDLWREGIDPSVPMQVQCRIPKRSDVRVVVVQEEVFATRIVPSDAEQPGLDWRLDQLKGRELDHVPFSLPPRIEDLSRQLPRHFGLKYSSMDLVEDEEGEFWFLELNPNGQWAWIEQITGYQIRDAIIRALGV